MAYRSLLTVTLILLLSACSIHKINIQQGNIIEDEQLEKLHVGMKRQQVVRLLGTPLVQDPFRQDRWDYVYYFKPANKTADLYQLVLFFEGDHLINFSTDIPQRRPKPVEESGDDPSDKSI
jgi:outer membrane protein assembly factor BamE